MLSLRSTRRFTNVIAGLFLPCALAACADDDTRPKGDRVPLGAVDGGGSTPSGADGGVSSGLDGGTGAPVEIPPPPEADWDGAVPESVIGKTYAETSYEFLAPASLATAFNTLAGDPGATHMFVNDFRSAAGSTEVRYGAASPDPDGGLAFQEALPVRTFRIAPSVDDANTLVSEQFTYTLRALVDSPLGSSRFMLSIEAVNAIWTASVSADFGALTGGTLYGVVTREEAETRPLKLGLLCPVVCGLSAPECAGSGVSTLAGMLDCTHTELDADADGDGELDGYNLAISFASERIEFAAAGQ